MPRPENDLKRLHAETSSSESYPIRLTPEGDSDGSDLELDNHEVHESYELQSREKQSSGNHTWSPSEAAANLGDRSARRASISTVQSFMLYTPDEEKAIIRKFDRRLVLFVALLYMLSFLDRSSKYSAWQGLREQEEKLWLRSAVVVLERIHGGRRDCEPSGLQNSQGAASVRGSSTVYCVLSPSSCTDTI